MKKTAISLLLLASSSLSHAAPEAYDIDNSHSFANFALRHVVAKASGTFSDITGKIVIDRDDLSKSSVNAVINVLSVNTSHAKRDEHIKKADYLDAGQYSEMRFVSSRVEAVNANEGILHGELTLHGVTRPMSFPFKVLGFGADPWGGQRMGVEAHTTLKASDFGFAWPLKAGAPVGNDIEITLLIEAVKEKAK